MKFEKPDIEPASQDKDEFESGKKVAKELSDQRGMQKNGEELRTKENGQESYSNFMARLRRRLDIIHRFGGESARGIQLEAVVEDAGDIGPELNEMQIETFTDPSGAPPQEGMEGPVLGAAIKIRAKRGNIEDGTPVQQAFARQFSERVYPHFMDAKKAMREWLDKYKTARNI